jgi:CheY-like chemotaxis protein
MAEFLADMLRELGYDVVGPVPGTAQAHCVIAEEPPDGALLDVHLRGELVTSVAQRLRELGRPFVFLTADSDLAALPEAYRESSRVLKPCTPDALRAALAEILPRG